MELFSMTGMLILGGGFMLGKSGLLEGLLGGLFGGGGQAANGGGAGPTGYGNASSYYATPQAQRMLPSRSEYTVEDKTSIYDEKLKALVDVQKNTRTERTNNMP